MKPIYFYHVEKTGGRSLRISFINHLIEKYKVSLDPIKVHFQSASKSFEIGPYIIGGEESNFEWNGGHQRYNKNRCKDYYSIFLLRNPTDRVLSFLRMMYAFKLLNSKLKFYEDHKYLIEGSFFDFVKKCPDEILNRHVYLLSGKMSVNKALDNLDLIDRVIFAEHYQEGLNKISLDLELTPPLKEFHFRGESEKGPPNKEIINGDKKSLKLLKEKLKPDITLYNEALKKFL